MLDVSTHLRIATFSHFLAAPVLLSSTDSALPFTDREYIGEQLILGSATITRCTFAHTISNSPGGAISASAPLTVRASVFRDCHSRRGGAISSTASLEFASTAFTDCTGQRAGAIDSQTNGTVLTEFSTDQCEFTNNSAQLFGTLYKRSLGTMTLSYTNFTDSRSDGCVGCGEMKSPMVTWRYAALVRSRAGSHNGAVCMRGCGRVVIAWCLFMNCSHRSSEKFAAACLLVYDNPEDSGLANTNFVNCDADKSYLVTVTSGSNLTVADCSFSGSRARELNENLFLLDGCAFEQSDFPAIRFEIARHLTTAASRLNPRALVPAALLAAAVTSAVFAAWRRLRARKARRAIQ